MSSLLDASHLKSWTRSFSFSYTTSTSSCIEKDNVKTSGFVLHSWKDLIQFHGLIVLQWKCWRHTRMSSSTHVLPFNTERTCKKPKSQSRVWMGWKDNVCHKRLTIFLTGKGFLNLQEEACIESWRVLPRSSSLLVFPTNSENKHTRNLHRLQVPSMQLLLKLQSIPT